MHEMCNSSTPRGEGERGGRGRNDKKQGEREVHWRTLRLTAVEQDKVVVRVDGAALLALLQSGGTRRGMDSRGGHADDRSPTHVGKSSAPKPQTLNPNLRLTWQVECCVLPGGGGASVVQCVPRC